jgi:hypothetical protein
MAAKYTATSMRARRLPLQGSSGLEQTWLELEMENRAECSDAAAGGGEQARFDLLQRNPPALVGFTSINGGAGPA